MTPQRKFEFRQMPFGMRNALASFQRAMDIMNWSHAVGIIRTNELHNLLKARQINNGNADGLSRQCWLQDSEDTSQSTACIPSDSSSSVRLPEELC